MLVAKMSIAKMLGKITRPKWTLLSLFFVVSLILICLYLIAHEVKPSSQMLSTSEFVLEKQFFIEKKHSVYQVILFPPGSAHSAQENMWKPLLPITHRSLSLPAEKAIIHSSLARCKGLRIRYENSSKETTSPGFKSLCSQIVRVEFIGSTDGRKSFHTANISFTQT